MGQKTWGNRQSDDAIAADVVVVSRSPSDIKGMAAVDPIVVVLSTACERLLRTIPDVSINLLELNSGVDASGQPGAAYAAYESKPKAVPATAQKGGLNGAAPCVGTDCRIVSRARAWQFASP